MVGVLREEMLIPLRPRKTVGAEFDFKFVHTGTDTLIPTDWEDTVFMTFYGTTIPTPSFCIHDFLRHDHPHTQHQLHLALSATPERVPTVRLCAYLLRCD